MLEPSVRRAGENILRKPQLFNVAKPLEARVIHHRASNGVECDVPVDFVADDQSFEGHYFKAAAAALSLRRTRSLPWSSSISKRPGLIFPPVTPNLTACAM